MEQRGPEPSRRMSLAILKSEVAMALSWPWASTSASRAAWRFEGFSARWNSRPERSLRRAMAVSGILRGGSGLCRWRCRRGQVRAGP